jgi:hypothetical protein
MPLKDLEERRLYALRYREKNIDACKERDRAYYENNTTAISERRRDYREKNIDACKERERAWREKNREKLKDTVRRTREKNRERIRDRERDRTGKEVAELTNTYVKDVLRRHTGLRSSDIPPELIEAKRLEIKLKRLIKELKA